MKLELAEALVDWMSGSVDVRLEKEYSGRGMYGSTTAAVILGQHYPARRTIQIALDNMRDEAEVEEDDAMLRQHGPGVGRLLMPDDEITAPVPPWRKR